MAPAITATAEVDVVVVNVKAPTSPLQQSGPIQVSLSPQSNLSPPSVGMPYTV